MFENFTGCAIRAIANAMDSATPFGHDKVDTDLMLLSLASDDCIASNVLSEHGISTDAIRRYIVFGVSQPKVEVPFKQKCKEAIAAAREYALKMGHPSVTTAHLLISIVTSKDCDGAQILEAIKGNALPDLEVALKTRLLNAMQDPSVEHIDQTSPSRDELVRRLALIARNIADWEQQLKNALEVAGISASEIRAELRKD